MQLASSVLPGALLSGRTHVLGTRPPMSSLGKRRSSLGHQGAEALAASSQTVKRRMRAWQEVVRRWVRLAEVDEGIDLVGLAKSSPISRA